VITTVRSRSSCSYLERSYYEYHVSRGGLKVTFVREHRPLHVYVDALVGEGLLIEQLRETDVPDAVITQPRSRRWQRIPLFLHIRAVK
jgi:hypothetical protein